MKDLLLQSDEEKAVYKNPVLHADYSDPDVIVFGDYFYMTASSFQYTPGLPILRSPNLADWELVAYALPEIPEERYALPQISEGVWAPSIRVHEGKVWIFYGMPDEGIYALTADHPEGPWSRPQLIRAGKGLIDPCPYWDKEGNAYVVHAYAKSRIGFKSVLSCFQFMKQGRPFQGEDRLIYLDHENQPTLEGPKVYERGDYLYIFAPAGGVVTGWQTVLRGRSVYGPFETRVVMRQGKSPTNGPHQGAWVQDFSGKDCFVHFQDKGAYGRIIHLQPMCWRDDWPIIGEPVPGEDYGEPVLEYALPAAKKTSRTKALAAADPFTGERPGLQWQWYGNPPEKAWRMERGLVLRAQNADAASGIELWQKPNLLTQKLISPAAFYETEIDGSLLEAGDAAGLAILGDQYLALSLRGEGGGRLVLARGTRGEAEQILFEKEISADRLKLQLFIKETEEGPEASFAFAEADSAGEPEPLPALQRLKPNTWTGAKPALFAVCAGKKTGGEARFSYFKAETDSGAEAEGGRA